MSIPVRRLRRSSSVLALLFSCCVVTVLATGGPVSAQALDLPALVAEALQQNPELSAAQARVTSARHRIPQAKALPDPSISAGYTNVGLSSYTFGKYDDAQWAFSASQTIPFPGKLIQKGKVAEKESETLSLQLLALKLATVARVKELYYDLFVAHRTMEILAEKAKLLEQVEKAALSRYASTMGGQGEAVMAQTEKYMLMEKVEMVRQRLNTLEGMLNATLGRDVKSPLGKPGEPSKAPYKKSLDDLLVKAAFDSPENKARMKKVEKAEARVSQAKAEFVPDVTLSAGYGQKGYRANQEPYMTVGEGIDITGTPGYRQRWIDMWSASVSMTVPIFFFMKQAEGLKESRSDLSESKYDLEASKNMIASSIRENYSMLQSAERLSELISTGTLPKVRQDFQLAMAGYAGGKGDIYAVVGRLKSLLDYEAQYWAQLAEKQKAVARLESLAGITDGLTLPKSPDSVNGTGNGGHKDAMAGQQHAKSNQQ
ncbi:MAG: TolC family protein [Desulfovibrio sp.]|nr:TolC family protein [Desulfovibrio sp.]MBI4961235.1 TolC family protein [Desulfovibrio sp.]